MGTGPIQDGDGGGVEYYSAINGVTITLGATIAHTTTNIQQLKTMPYLHVPQFSQLQTKAEVELKEPTSCHQLLNLPQT